MVNLALLLVSVFLKIWLVNYYLQEKKESKKFQELSDLRLDEKTYSLEKALLLMYDRSKGLDNFKGRILSECREKSQRELLARIESIQAIHDIR